MLSYEKKEGEKILLSIFGFKICVVVFNQIMCCYAETKKLVISRAFFPCDLCTVNPFLTNQFLASSQDIQQRGRFRIDCSPLGFIVLLL